QHSAGNPRCTPQGAEVGDHHHVAIPALPIGECVAVNGIEFDVDRQQVVATLSSVVFDVVKKQPCRYAFSRETPLHIGKGDDHGIDLARCHQGAKFFNAEVSAGGGHRAP